MKNKGSNFRFFFFDFTTEPRLVQFCAPITGAIFQCETQVWWSGSEPWQTKGDGSSRSGRTTSGPSAVTIPKMSSLGGSRRSTTTIPSTVPYSGLRGPLVRSLSGRQSTSLTPISRVFLGSLGGRVGRRWTSSMVGVGGKVGGTVTPVSL